MIISNLLTFSRTMGGHCVSGLRRMLCLAALIVGFAAEVWSEDEAFSYDLYVGGVKVTSSNAANITGSNITACNSTVNGGKPKVYYDGKYNTLYLYNVNISRTGKNNHAIESDVPNLRIVLYGNGNLLKATDASPVRLNANTLITTTFEGQRYETFIYGGDEDAVYAGKKNGKSPEITIYDAKLSIKSQSSAFDTEGGTSLVIKNSIVDAVCENGSSGDHYALFDYNSLTIQNSDVSLTGYPQAIKNLSSLTLGPGMYYDTPSDGWFKSTTSTVVNRAGNAAKEVIFKMSTIGINSTNFPDANFRNWVLAQDCGKDGYLIPSEIAAVERIDVKDKSIASLKGIEHFTALKYLFCDNNSLTWLDVSKNTALATFSCSNNSLYSLDVSKNTELTYLDCSNNSLKKLDVSNNTALHYLDCSNNSLGTLSLSNNTYLKELRCSNNGVASLDLSKSTKLAYLDCSRNSLGTLILPRNFALTKLYCNRNQLTSLNVSNNTTLTELDCSLNNLNTLDVSNNTALTDLNCRSNNLNTLDVSNNTALTDLNCRSNNLTSLDVLKNTALTDLDCSSNSLETLDVSNNKALTRLYCSLNNLSSLDLSNNTVLGTLYCQDNNLTSLDLSKNPVLRYVTIYANGIRGKAMTTFINRLCSVPTQMDEGILHIVCKGKTVNMSNEITAKQVNMAKNKRWRVMIQVDHDWVDYEGLPEGDVNTDGSVDNKDVEALAKYIMGKLPDADKWFYDVDGNGKVDAADIVYVINILNK